MTGPDRRTVNDEAGMAMMMVIGFMLVAGVIVATALSYATSLQPRARYGEDGVKALSAAQAGIDHYLGHLNQDRNYFRTTDCTNPALKGPNTDPARATYACGWGPSTPVGWVTVQADDAASAEFHYDIDSRQMDQFTIWVSSTGRAGNVLRTLQAKVTIAGSQRYLYVTDFEDADPQNTYAYPAPDFAKYDDCGKSGAGKARYYWQDEPNLRKPSSSCVEITFISGDTLDGPVHFNDTPLMSGSPKFLQGFTTFATGCSAATPANCYRGSGSPQLGAKGARWANRNDLPDTTGDLKSMPGCHFTGDTRIKFNKGQKTMTVWNTKSANAGRAIAYVGTPAAIAAAPNCGIAGNYKPASSSDPRPAASAKQTVPVPDGLIIYVHKSLEPIGPCVPGQIVNEAGPPEDRIPISSGGLVSDIGFLNPTYTRTRSSTAWGPLVRTATTHPTSFDCGQGNVYVEGSVGGRVTIAAEDNIVVTGDLLIDSTAKGQATGTDDSDIVGLVAQNSVVIYHPAAIKNWKVTPAGSTTPSCGSKPSDTPTGGKAGSTCTYKQPDSPSASDFVNLTYGDGATDRWVYASIQTLSHSFWVENYRAGAKLGTLSVRGSIAQRWRGVVGQSGSTGYLKDYSYDKRLQTTSPPYFPPWANGDWTAATTGELPTLANIR